MYQYHDINYTVVSINKIKPSLELFFILKFYEKFFKNDLFRSKFMTSNTKRREIGRKNP